MPLSIRSFVLRNLAWPAAALGNQARHRGKAVCETAAGRGPAPHTPHGRICCFQNNSRTTVPRGGLAFAAKSAEFLSRLMPRPAACALLSNTRTTDSPAAAKSAEFLSRLMPRPAACALPVAALLLSLFVVGLPLQAQMPDSFFGVRMVDVDAGRAVRLKLHEEQGVEVVSVADDSPADAAGIQVGDALLSYNGENILGAQQLVRLVRETPPGRKVRVQLWRAGKAQTVAVTLAAVQGQANRSFPSLAFSGNGQNPAMTSAAGNFTVNIPEPSAANMPDTPIMLLVWHNTLLGVECEGVDADLARYFGVKQGILVRAVEHNGPGDRAGVKPGDILVSIADRPLTSPRDLNAFHRAFRVDSGRNDNKSIPLALMRDRKSVKLNVAVTSVPE